MQSLIVVPTYNEARNVPELAAQLFALGLPDLHILVVDDNSPDGTADVAEGLNGTFPGRLHVLRRAAKEGLGKAYVAGFKEALRLGAGNVIQMDADLSHPPSAVPRLLEALETSDVAVGSRYIEGGGAVEEWGLLRKLISRGGDIYVRAVLGLPIQDTKSGFKAFRREVLENVGLDQLASAGYIFQAEFVFRCHKMGYRMREVPFVFQERRAGKSKMSVGILVEALWRSVWLRMKTRAIPRQVKT
ncbi:MAG: polyprenol monophosphomannose synthase [Chloroflexi bacterium]|nr:polyprenol monophosphomannose synthase [Chloroflexota bacterium]